MLGVVKRGHMVRTGGARPGDVVLMAGVAPVEGTSIIAREMRSQLLARGWPAAMIEEAAQYLHEPGISILEPAQLAAQSGLVTAMHDPTEGGVATGLLELSVAAEVGLVIDLEAIPVPALAARLCAEFALDPLGTVASGALLATVPAQEVATLRQLWREHGWPSTEIGRVLTAAEGLCAYRSGLAVAFPRFAVDEITKLWN
jgi:hydrogenase maturation factor